MFPLAELDTLLQPRKFILPLILAGILVLVLAGAGLGAWRAVVNFRAMIAEIKSEAAAARDMYWQAAIAKANAETERLRADYEMASHAAQEEATAQIASLNTKLDELEAANAALPKSDRCGLGRERVRLLNR